MALMLCTSHVIMTSEWSQEAQGCLSSKEWWCS